MARSMQRSVTMNRPHEESTERSIPVIAERVVVGTRTVETGRVRVEKTVTTREETVDLPAAREEVTVERVAIGRFVDGPERLRREGDVTIVPIYEEVVVVEKKLLLREEIRLTRRRTESHASERVTLRREEATIERHAGGAEPSAKEKRGK